MRTALALAAVALVASAAAHGATPRWHAWLCLPGKTPNYCRQDLSATAEYADGSHRVVTAKAAADPPVDCFYAYPTVSNEQRPNSDLVPRREEQFVAFDESAPFSMACRVFAPMYRQVTTNAGRGSVAVGNYELEYDDVLAAWRDYLAHWNHGRGVILVGHSAGAGLFKRLLTEQGASVRKVLVSAVLLGGSVAVDARDRFAGFPACASRTQTGCIVAFSSWDRTPPADANFERVDSPSQHVLCVNPASPAGGSAPITPFFPWFEPEGIAPPTRSAPVSTLWISYPGLYTARCVRRGERAWLLVSRIRHPRDRRPALQEVFGSSWGLHAADVNIAFAELIGLVESQASAYAAKH